MKRKLEEIIYSQLREAQEKYGGYTGNDIAIISRKINRQPKTVRRHIEKLREKDAAFSNFTYIGKRYTDLTLDEISFLQYKLQDNCLMLKSLFIIGGIKYKEDRRGEKPDTKIYFLQVP